MMPNIQNVQQMLGQIKANPMQFLLQRKMNVPQNMMNDPQAIINHLVQTGQVNQNQINSAYQMAQQMGFKR
jgi:hypothetical protein